MSEYRAIMHAINDELTEIRQELDLFSKWVVNHDRNLDDTGTEELLNMQDTLNQFACELDAIKGDDLVFLSTAKEWKYRLLGYYAITKARLLLARYKLGKSAHEKSVMDTKFTIYDTQDLIDGTNEYMLWVQRDINYITAPDYLRSLLETYRIQRAELRDLRERYVAAQPQYLPEVSC